MALPLVMILSGLQVQDLNHQQYNARYEVDRLNEMVNQKERENMKVWEQMQSASTEYHQEFLAKEAAVTELIAERDSIARNAEDSARRQHAFMEVGCLWCLNIADP